jgi:NADPH:quinone reductase-like Zn-dependent oxidoreductase
MIESRPDGKRLAEITPMIDAKLVRPHIQTVLPLAEAGRAFEMSRSRHVGGKIVLTPPA